MNKYLKYAACDVTFAEYPNEVALYIEISGCPIHCPECHSKFLWEDVGVELTPDVIKHLIRANEGITAVVIGGGDQDENGVMKIVRCIHFYFPTLKICWYSGKPMLSEEMLNFIKKEHIFSALKIGSYIEQYGPLNNKNTNQRFYFINYQSDKPLLDDKTSLFWKNPE